MTRLIVAGAVAVALFAAGAAALVAWLTGAPGASGGLPAERDVAAVAPAAEHPLVALPPEHGAREAALEENEARRAFDALARGFAATERTPASEARLLPAIDVLFPRGGPRWSLECRRAICRLEADAPAAEWRAALAENAIARQQVDRTAFDPGGAGIAYLELVAAKVAAGPARPDGERVLDALERDLLASEAARGCVADGPAPGAEVRLMIDRSGVTYRFGAAVDANVATCLMMRALPDVVGGAAAPPNVRRAERKVLVTAAR